MVNKRTPTKKQNESTDPVVSNALTETSLKIKKPRPTLTRSFSLAEKQLPRTTLAVKQDDGMLSAIPKTKKVNSGLVASKDSAVYFKSLGAVHGKVNDEHKKESALNKIQESSISRNILVQDENLIPAKSIRTKIPQESVKKKTVSKNSVNFGSVKKVSGSGVKSITHLDDLRRGLVGKRHVEISSIAQTGAEIPVLKDLYLENGDIENEDDPIELAERAILEKQVAAREERVRVMAREQLMRERVRAERDRLASEAALRRAEREEGERMARLREFEVNKILFEQIERERIRQFEKRESANATKYESLQPVRDDTKKRVQISEIRRAFRSQPEDIRETADDILRRIEKSEKRIQKVLKGAGWSDEVPSRKSMSGIHAVAFKDEIDRRAVSLSRKDVFTTLTEVKKLEVDAKELGDLYKDVALVDEVKREVVIEDVPLVDLNKVDTVHPVASAAPDVSAQTENGKTVKNSWLSFGNKKAIVLPKNMLSENEVRSDSVNVEMGAIDEEKLERGDDATFRINEEVFVDEKLRTAVKKAVDNKMDDDRSVKYVIVEKTLDNKRDVKDSRLSRKLSKIALVLVCAIFMYGTVYFYDAYATLLELQRTRPPVKQAAPLEVSARNQSAVTNTVPVSGVQAPTVKSLSDIEKSMLGKMAKYTAIPLGEIPNIHAVTDKSKLVGEALFKNVENGDIVAIFPVAKSAVVYRPSSDKVIAAGPYNGQ